MKRIDNLVDNLTATIQELATELKEKSTYLRERHELLIAIRKLEPNGSDPIKDLRERLRTLKAIKELQPNGPEIAMFAHLFIDLAGSVNPLVLWHHDHQRTSAPLILDSQARCAQTRQTWKATGHAKPRRDHL